MWQVWPSQLGTSPPDRFRVCQHGKASAQTWQAIAETNQSPPNLCRHIADAMMSILSLHLNQPCSCSDFHSASMQAKERGRIGKECKDQQYLHMVSFSGKS